MESNTFGEFRYAGLLEYEIGCAFLDGVFYFRSIVRRCEHDYGHVGSLANDCAGVGSAHFGHAHVENDEIGFEFEE